MLELFGLQSELRGQESSRCGREHPARGPISSASNLSAVFWPGESAPPPPRPGTELLRAAGVRLPLPSKRPSCTKTMTVRD